MCIVLTASTMHVMCIVLYKTAETLIKVDFDRNGTGKLYIDCGLPFFEHLLDQVAHHGKFHITLTCNGDLDVDAHHTIEDIGIALGRAVSKYRGINRYGSAYVPLDEALSRVVIDFSGRPGLYMDAMFTSARIGKFSTQLCFEFFHGFVNNASATLHIENIQGFNTHHQVETIFKAFGRALRMAVEYDPRILSTKYRL